MKFNKEITQERLKELLEYNPVTGALVWITKTAPMATNIKVGHTAGTLQHGYTVIKIDGVPYKAHRLVWLYHFGVFPLEEVDHEDGNRSNNRLENLREVSHLVNTRNQKKRSTNSSGTTGVFLRKKTIKGKIYESWVAVWRDLLGTQRETGFSLVKYGTEQALFLATTLKAIRIQELNALGAGYTERHGKQPTALTSPLPAPQQ